MYNIYIYVYICVCVCFRLLVPTWVPFVCSICVCACVRACVRACVTYQIRVIGKPMSPV